MKWAPKLLFFCALCLSLALDATPAQSRGTKGRRGGSAKVREHLRAQESSPDPVLRVNPGALTDYTFVEDYERSIQEMVNQLRNSSELLDSKCQVNLRLWMSNKRSLSPWAYRMVTQQYFILNMMLKAVHELTIYFATEGKRSYFYTQLVALHMKGRKPKRISHDASRVPVDIPEAHCLCAGCINPFTMQEDRTMISIPIYSKIPVRRMLCEPSKPHRKKKKCHKEYKMVMETIAVGCTCIF